MAANNGQFEPDNSADFSDETIRRFLLGGLSASEQPAFEQRLLIDRALARRVHLAELELADDYAYERLSRAERELVAERFLLTADREQQVRVSRSLRDQFAPAPASSSGPAVAAYVERLRSSFSVAQPAWRFAFAAVIFILVVGTVWVVVKKEPAIKAALTGPFRKRPTPTVPIVSHHTTNTSTPEHQTIPSPMPVHDQPAPPASPSVIVALTPAGTADSGNMPSVELSKGDQDIVRLQLAVKFDQPGPYRAELLNGDGQSVFSAESLKSGGNGNEQVDFDVPARLLKGGNYRIRLRRDAGAKEEVSSYYFRAQ